MLRSVLVASLLLMSARADAQLLIALDRTAIPGLGPEVPIPFDLDANPLTRDFIQSRYDATGAYELRGVTVRDGAVCLGAWIRPFEIATAGAVPWDVLLVGATFDALPGRFVVIGIRGYYEVQIPTGC